MPGGTAPWTPPQAAPLIRKRLVQPVGRDAGQLRHHRRSRPRLGAGVDEPAQRVQRRPDLVRPSTGRHRRRARPRLAAARTRTGLPARPQCRGRSPRGAWSARGRPRPGARGRGRREPVARRPPALATRTRPTSRARRTPASSAPFLRGRNPANRHRSAGSALATSAASAADGPGRTSTASPAATHACTRTNPGSDTSGVPASETSATTAPSRIFETSSAARARSLCSW